MELDGAPGVGGPQGGSLPKAAGITWDLTRIFPDDAAALRAFTHAVQRAQKFEKRYRGRVVSLSDPQLAVALKELEAIQRDARRAASYAGLRSATNAADTGARDLENAIDDASLDFANALRFFELEWQALTPRQAVHRSASPALQRWRHYLEQVTADAAHTLSEGEEAALAARSAAASSEWQQLWAEEAATATVSFDSGNGIASHTVDETLAMLYNPDAATRRNAQKALMEAMEPHARILARCYNALVTDRLARDKIRGYSSPMEAANVSNDLSDAAVNSLLTGVAAHYSLGQRWYRSKARLLGVKKLHLADQYAPLGATRTVLYADGVALFRAAMKRFGARPAQLVDQILHSNSIDAQPRPGKRGGAFCTPVAPGDTPMMLLNYTDQLDDVFTLAHEAGHGLHFLLAGKAQSPLSAGTGMAMAEVASTFNEMLLFDYVLSGMTDPAERRALIASRVEAGFATVFRQTMMSRFEAGAYALRASGKSLTPDALCAIWMNEVRQQYGDAVEIPEYYRFGWSYIPHFINTRFYTYSYSFAHLAALALYAQYRSQGASFVPKYLSMLAAGGSQSPQQLLGAFGIDITDPHWVDASFAELERMVELAEAAPGQGSDLAA